MQVTQVLERRGRLRITAESSSQAKELAEVDARAGHVIFDDETEISLTMRAQKLESWNT